MTIVNFHAEFERLDAEEARLCDENVRIVAEDERIIAEYARLEAEDERIDAEYARLDSAISSAGITSSARPRSQSSATSQLPRGTAPLS